MKKLIAFFAGNSILVNSLTIFILVAGTMTVFKMDHEARPPANLGQMFITTVYPGASPVDVEKLVTIPIEDEVVQVDGLKKLISTSYAGMSRIYIEIDPDVDEDDVISSVYRAVNRVTGLPEDATDPETYEVKTANFPVLSIAIYSDNNDIEELYKATDLIERRLESLNFISKADVKGRKDPVFDIIVNPNKLSKNNISIGEIIGAISNYNLTGPAGSIVSQKEDTLIRLDNELTTSDKLANVVIRVNELGKDIKIRNLATVRASYKNDRTEVRSNGKLATYINISKAESGDTVRSVKQAREELAKIMKILPKSIHYNVIWDDSIYVKDTLKFTSQNAMLGFILMLIILFFGLNNFRMSAVTALGLPIAFLGSLVVIYMLGHSLNMMTLIGMILVIGMLVDDGIVIGESIYYNMEKGMSPRKAAVEGTWAVFWPVIGAVSTTIVAFTPLLYLSGIIGKFMQIIPIAVISSLALSLFECLFILPNHAIEIMKFGKRKAGEKTSGIMKKIEIGYGKLLKKMIKRRWTVSFLTLLFMILVGVGTAKFLKVELFSIKGIPNFSIHIRGKENITIEKTIKMAEKIEKIMDSFMPNRVESHLTQIGQVVRQHGMYMDVGTNYVSITAYLPTLKKRKEKEQVTIDAVREAVSKLDLGDFEWSLDILKSGPPSGKPVDVSIVGKDFKLTQKLARKIEKFLKHNPSFTDINSTANLGKQEYLLTLKQKTASELGITARAIQLATMSAFEGLKITSIRKGIFDCDIRVVYPKKYRTDINNLLKLTVPSRFGTHVPLSKLLTVNKQATKSSIIRDFRERIENITANITKDMSAAKAYKIVSAYTKELNKEYPNVKFKFGGESEEQKEIVKEMAMLFGIAFLAIFMIIVLILGNIKYPIFIVMAIPFGFAGAMLALMMHGTDITIGVLVSLIGLSGVVVNDSILLVKTIFDKRKQEDLTLDEAIIAGATRRLRPITITSLTTLAGLFPAAYELMGTGIFMKQMSLTLGWGLFFSTILTMLAMPSIISATGSIVAKKRQMKTVK